MSVAKSSVGNQQTLLRFHPLRKSPGPNFVQQLASSRRRLSRDVRRNGRRLERNRPRLACHFRIPVYDCLAEIRQQPGGAILPRRELEQRWSGIEKRRVYVAATEVLVVDD